ncbi:dTMP kinase [Candidatus Kaiserbacteria bacterium]|nr:dTMP kinase [Candidatus Kaiserbacteria bacterium]
MKGAFFVVDGIGGAGKTTQLAFLKKKLGKRALFTHEPGGAPRAERIRSILKAEQEPQLDPLTDFFLFWAARAEHVGARILPALKKGKVVISDRFDSSTFAMQVRGDRQKSIEKLFWQCREHTLAGCEPDLYIILDAPIAAARKRRHGRSSEDRFDEKNEAYQARVRAGYLEFAKRFSKRAVVIPALLPPQEVQRRMWEEIEKRI